MYPAAVCMPVYQVSVYRASGRIGQHAFRRRRFCSSQTVYHTFCRHPQATQRRHNLLPTPMTPSASAEAEGFSVRRRMLTMPTCMPSMRVQLENRGSQRNPTVLANHPRARPTSHAMVFVRDRPRAQPSSHSTALTRMHPSSVANRKTRRARRQPRCTPPRAPTRPRQET